MGKQKILFITPSLCQGGIEHSLIMMLKLLDKSRFDITLLLFHDDITLLPLVPKEVRVVRNKDTSHYYRRPFALFLQTLQLFAELLHWSDKEVYYAEELRSYIHTRKAMHPAKAYFPKEVFDIVVSYAIGISTEMALFVQAKKRIVWYHASVDMHHEMLVKVFPQYDSIIAVSEGVKEMLQNAYPTIKKKVVVIENYVDAEEIITKSQMQSPIKLEKKGFTICSCGRLTSEKGFDMAVDAAVILQKRGIEFIWYFIGDGTERNVIEGKINNLGLLDSIIITGFTDNPFCLMKECDVYVQPSYEESYGRTIKEAIILGKPVVSTATVGGKTLLGDGKYGLLTEINAESLASGIINIQTMRLAKYDIEVNSQERSLYQHLLNEQFS